MLSRPCFCSQPRQSLSHLFWSLCIGGTLGICFTRLSILSLSLTSHFSSFFFRDKCWQNMGVGRGCLQPLELICLLQPGLWCSSPTTNPKTDGRSEVLWKVDYRGVVHRHRFWSLIHLKLWGSNPRAMPDSSVWENETSFTSHCGCRDGKGTFFWLWDFPSQWSLIKAKT